MWKLICKNEFPHLTTILVTWSKTKQPHKYNNTHKRQTSVKTSLYAGHYAISVTFLS